MTDYLPERAACRPPVGWWDVLDILIVSILIYELLKLIRGTRAVQMAVRVAARSLALFYVSRLAPLRDAELADPQRARLRRLRGHRHFQSDIRRALAHFGAGAVLPVPQRASEASDETIEEVVVATTMLSRRRRWAGSSRSSARSACATTSKRHPARRDAHLRSAADDLQPGSPLHDGAVILQEGPRRRGGVLPAADRQPATEPRARHATPRRDRRDGRKRRGRDRRARKKPASSRSRSTGRSSGDSPPARCGIACAASFRDGRADALQPVPESRSQGHGRHTGDAALDHRRRGEHVVERSLRVPLEFRNVPETLEIVGEHARPPWTCGCAARRRC